MSWVPSSNRILTRKLCEQSEIVREAARTSIAEATETVLRSKHLVALAKGTIAHAQEVVKRADEVGRPTTVKSRS